MKKLLMIVGLLAMSCVAKDIEVVAVYYPHWHKYAKGTEWFGKEWDEGEWCYVKTARPRFRGHHQPLVPLAGYLKGDDPNDMAKEIALAANAGIDVFLYDYYYYDGKITQEESLEQGFLKAPNRSRMKFALMWCYHERRDQFRPEKDAPRRMLMELAHTPQEFQGLIDLSIQRYFPQPEYWRKDGKLFFSIYNAPYFYKYLGAEAVKATLAEAREKVRKAGLGELHFNAQNVPPAKIAEFAALGFDSVTDYNIGPGSVPNWHARYQAGAREIDYGEILEANYKRWKDCSCGPIPYIPSVTTGWDRTPRCKPTAAYPWPLPSAYPYESTVTNNTPDRFEVALRKAKEFALSSSLKPGAVYINGWNEYTEGAWLVPDNFYGDGLLRAVAAVFGRTPANEYTFVDKFSKKLYTIPAATFENVAYDTKDAKQKLDVWLPQGVQGKRPCVIYYHGGGWSEGTTVDRIIANSLTNLLAHGVAVVAVGYRYIRDNMGERPPVMAPLNDAEAALKFVRAHAEEWKIDLARIGLAGGSAGAATILYLGLKNDNEYGVAALAPIIPQTSMDPKETREWIPNAHYGAHAFGYRNFDEWLANRAKCLPMIEKISGAALVRRITPQRAPKIFIQCNAPVVQGVLPKDPTHASEFAVQFKTLCDARQIQCDIAYGSKNYYGNAFEVLCKALEMK